MNPLANRSLLITGGTGSFGTAYARHALECGARRVAILSRDEAKQYHMAREFRDRRMRWLIGDVSNEQRMLEALTGAEVVIHAAAMKQVPTCQANPDEAIRTNVDGTRAVRRAAVACGVERAVFLSTDKACAPNTLYGKTKAVAEDAWIQGNVYAAGTPTRFLATRYGNVLASRGSVIEVWRREAEAKQSLTVTDPSMTRFWMPLSTAVWLVDLALTHGRGGEIFVPKIGSANINTLAEAAVPNVEHLNIIGVRRGEKMDEMLITEDEARDTYEYDTHYVVEPERTWEYLPPLEAPRVPLRWSYRSDTNPDQLTIEQLRVML